MITRNLEVLRTGSLPDNYPDVLEELVREDNLLFETTLIHLRDGNKHIENTDYHLRVKLSPSGEIKVPFLITKIPISAIAQLFVITREMVSSFPARYLTGVEIHFGCVNNAVCLIFQPVFMTWNRFDSITGSDIYSITKDSNYYSYDSTTEKFVPESNVTTLKDVYKNSILIKHNKNTTTSFDPHNSVDVTSLIIPFQAIVGLMECDNVDRIFLYNCVRERNHDENNSIKHSILFSTKKILTGSARSSRGDSETSYRFSNRSHLCPPCLDGGVMQVGFDIEEK